MVHRISFAAGNVPEFGPLDIYRAAVGAGYDLSGMWVDLETWTDQTTKDLKSAIAGEGVGILDVEVIWIMPNTPVDPLRKIIDIGGELNAQYGLVVSSDPDLSATKQGFETLCTHAEQVGLGLVFEPLPITEVKTLADAVEVASSVQYAKSGVLIDTLHFVRMGTQMSELDSFDRDLFPYMQFADAPAQLVDPTFDRLLEEAVDGRMLPGDGELPNLEILATLNSDIPISPEIRSKALREGYDDPIERAKIILDKTRDLLVT